MWCPNCNFAGTLESGTCSACGYRGQAYASPSNPALFMTPSPSPKRYVPERGDLLHRERYRIVSQYPLPETQHRQGLAWLATDMQSSHRRIIIRELLIPEHLARATSREHIAKVVAQQQSELALHAGFPQVVDLFKDQGAYFLALLAPEGESLAAWLQRQGGALPEYLVAELGYQVCGTLLSLANQQLPIVHGSITPETIIVGTEGQFVSILHVPLFPPDALPASTEKVSAGYCAPEQVHGEASPSSDLYGLAVVMHHAVTGYDPRTRLALFHPPARRLNPAVTPQMEKILTRQLSLSASQRYAGPREMQQDLAALLETYPDFTSDKDEHALQSIDHLTDTQLRERSRDALLLNMGILAAICVLLIVGTLFIVLRP
jgi:serine/threonine protein kinase